MSTIKLTNVKKVYDNKVVAVHDFNLDIQDKEFLEFICEKNEATGFINFSNNL